MGFKWLNENASLHDFESVDRLLTRLTDSIEPTKEIRALFNGKNTHVFVTAFKAFTESGMEDAAFNGFLKWFMDGGDSTEIDGKSWYMLDISHSTRDSVIVHGKIDYLVELIKRYSVENKMVA